MDHHESITKFDKVIKVAVVDDHQLFRSGMVSLLEDFKDIKVVLQASNGRDLLEQLEMLGHKGKQGKSNLPDVVLLDLQMPEMNGIQTTVYLQEEYPSIRIIILTMHNEEEFIFDLMNKGANGFLAKDKTVETVLEAIHSVHTDGVYVNEQVLRAVVRGSQRKDPSTGLKANVSELTDREIEIIQLICDQKTNKEIAEIFQLSTRTVENHRVAIFSKTGVKNMAGLVLYAIKHNLINIAK